MNWNQLRLGMDFSGMKASDIDMISLRPNGVLILGEIKNKFGTFSEGQRLIYTTIADRYCGDCIVLYITHNERVEEGAEKVEVAQQTVQEYYWKGQWFKTKTAPKVIDIYNYFDGRNQ